MSSLFLEVIKICFYQYEDFDDFLGQVYFMMILDTWNTYTTSNTEGAEKDFSNISLNKISQWKHIWSCYYCSQEY